MPVFDKPYPPANGNGRFFVHRGFWMQFDPLVTPGNRNFPFGRQDRHTPYRRLKVIGVFFGAASLELTFDVDAVDPASLDGVRDFLDAGGWQGRVELEFYKSGWAKESFRSAAAALARIAQIMAYRHLPLVTRTVIRRMDWDTFQSAPPLLRSCREIWHENPCLTALHRANLGRRLMVIAADVGGHPRIQRIGRHSAIARYFGEAWRRQALGRPVGASLPDRGYDRETARSVLQAVGSGESRYDLILASIERPLLGREWAAYHRLQIPFDDRLISVVQLVPLQELGIPFLTP